MIRMHVAIEDLFSPRLERFEKRAPTVALRICRTIAMAFRAYTKKNYLRGQIIGRRSGTLYKGIKIRTDRRTKDAVIVKPWARLANIYHNPDGATIVPSKAKALRFLTLDGETVFTKRVRISPRPWVPRAMQEFPWNVEIKKAGDKVIAREIEKLKAKHGTG